MSIQEMAMRIVAALVLATILMGIGASIDHKLYVVPLQIKLNQQNGADAQASHDAQLAVTKQEGTQNEATTRALQYYAGLTGNLNDALARMRKQPARVHIEYLPISSVSASGVDGASVEQGGTVPSYSIGAYIPSDCFGSSGDPCIVERGIYEGALKDAAKVEGWQDWAKRQGFPVE